MSKVTVYSIEKPNVPQNCLFLWEVVLIQRYFDQLFLFEKKLGLGVLHLGVIAKFIPDQMVDGFKMVICVLIFFN